LAIDLGEEDDVLGQSCLEVAHISYSELVKRQHGFEENAYYALMNVKSNVLTRRYRIIAEKNQNCTFSLNN
jgi:hypothetical protein